MNELTTAVELLKHDMQYLKDEMADIKKMLRDVIETKADRRDVEQLQANQNRVVWIVISTVVLAILGLIIKL